MASKFFISLVALIACMSRSSAGVDVKCEKLDVSTCAYAVSVSGMRCVLEKQVEKARLQETFMCQTSSIETEGIKNWVESDRCIKNCGLNRHIVGISTDFLLDIKFIKSLCSTECYSSCPNIVDLYFNLAASEDIYLPNLCESKMEDSRRAMVELENGRKLVVFSTKLQAASSPAEPPV